MHVFAAAMASAGRNIAAGNFFVIITLAQIFAAGAVIGNTIYIVRIIGTDNHAHTVAVLHRRIIAENRTVQGFYRSTKILIPDFTSGRVAVAPGTSLIFANGAFRAGFVLALGLAAFALVTLGNAERNAGLGVGCAAVLTVPVTLAGIVTVGGGNVLFAVAAVAGRYRRFARSLDFFFGGKSRAGVAAMPELV